MGEQSINQTVAWLSAFLFGFLSAVSAGHASVAAQINLNTPKITSKSYVISSVQPLTFNCYDIELHSYTPTGKQVVGQGCIGKLTEKGTNNFYDVYSGPECQFSPGSTINAVLAPPMCDAPESIICTKDTPPKLAQPIEYRRIECYVAVYRIMSNQEVKNLNTLIEQQKRRLKSRKSTGKPKSSPRNH